MPHPLDDRQTSAIALELPATRHLPVVDYQTRIQREAALGATTVLSAIRLTGGRIDSGQNTVSSEDYSLGHHGDWDVASFHLQRNPIVNGVYEIKLAGTVLWQFQVTPSEGVGLLSAFVDTLSVRNWSFEQRSY